MAQALEKYHPPETGIALREYLEHLLNARIIGVEGLISERDRLYGARFEAAGVAVNAALAAQEKAVSAAFLASEKAIIKAEDAQREYNVRSNEFRGQLDDQAKMLMPRAETMTMFRAMEERLESMRIFFNSQIENQRLSFEKAVELTKIDIMSLRESRSEVQGSHTSTREILSYVIASISILIALSSVFLKH